MAIFVKGFFTGGGANVTIDGVKITEDLNLITGTDSYGRIIYKIV